MQITLIDVGSLDRDWCLSSLRPLCHENKFHIISSRESYARYRDAATRMQVLEYNRNFANSEVESLVSDIKLILSIGCLTRDSRD